MKKIMILAAMAAAMTFTACGDDDSTSASSAESCKVTTTDNSATTTMSAAGISTTTTLTLTENGYRMTYGGFGSESLDPIDVPNKDITLDELVEIAHKLCMNDDQHFYLNEIKKAPVGAFFSSLYFQQRNLNFSFRLRKPLYFQLLSVPCPCRGSLHGGSFR